MGYVIRLKRNQLVGGNNNDEIYPITSTNAVYRGGKNLEDILDEIGRDVDSKKVIEVSYNESTNSIKVSYSNGDISNYTLPNCVKNVSFNNSTKQLTFTKVDNTTTTVTIQEPNNGKLTLKKGNNIIEFTANSDEDKSITIPNVSVNNANDEYPKYPGSVSVDSTTLKFPAIRIIPTFGIDKGTSMYTVGLADAIIGRNLYGLTNGNGDVNGIIDDNYTYFTDSTAVIFPRLPKLVAAVSTNGDKLRITYLEDTKTSGQSYTDIDLPSGGSTVTVSNKNATLNAGSNVTVATVNIDNSATDLKVNVPNFVVNNNSIKNIEYCASESAYNSSSKDSNTLYFIPVS